MMQLKKPWFEIISVRDKAGRSIADITKEVCGEFGISMGDVRGPRTYRKAVDARREALTRVFYERPDLTSNQVAMFMRCDGSTIRHFWRDLRTREAA